MSKLISKTVISGKPLWLLQLKMHIACNYEHLNTVDDLPELQKVIDEYIAKMYEMGKIIRSGVTTELRTTKAKLY